MAGLKQRKVVLPFFFFFAIASRNEIPSSNPQASVFKAQSKKVEVCSEHLEMMNL